MKLTTKERELRRRIEDLLENPVNGTPFKANGRGGTVKTLNGAHSAIKVSKEGPLAVKKGRKRKAPS